MSSLYKVRDWNIDHDRFSEAKQIDDVATELSAALGDMVRMTCGRQGAILGLHSLSIPVSCRACMSDRKLSRL